MNIDCPQDIDCSQDIDCPQDIDCSQEISTVEAFRKDPNLRACFIEMLDLAEDTNEAIQTADQAEEAVVSTTQNAAQTLLQRKVIVPVHWAECRAKQAHDNAENSPQLRPHEKKSDLGCIRRSSPPM